MIDPLNQYSFEFLCNFFLWKVLAATICGGVVGLERELKHKVAGIKTNILICVSSALFTATSFLVCAKLTGVDPSRIISYIISGIGFLGAGAIFKSRDKVIGLTTAAFIWSLSSIGIIIGAGGLLIGLVLTIGMLAITLILEVVERKYVRKS